MSKPPRLTLVDPSMTELAPPSTLNASGRALWAQVMKEYDVSDIAGRQMLEQCCAAADRAVQLASEIEADGPVLRLAPASRIIRH